MPGDMTVTTTSPAAGVATWTASATDAVAGNVAVTCTPASGSTFPIGTTSVTCSATDPSNNTATGQFDVTVTAALTASSVGTGEYHTCALLDDGAVSCWGENWSGQLGDGTYTGSLVPVAVTGITDAVSIAVGTGHTCVLLAGGAVSCWGHNGSGQLGDGTTTNRNVPGAVPGVVNAVSITAGAGHTCAVLIDTTVSCWGSNSNGQLGDGTNTLSKVPVVVSGLTNAASVAAGGHHTCAVLVDGAASCWGNNSWGQVGNGTNGPDVNSSVPVSVSGITDAVSIAAGWMHTCAVLGDGTVSCWGNNDSGQLGNGTDGPDAYSNVPVAVSGSMNAVTVTGGYTHTCAALTDGTARCWGNNEVGQLGDGANVMSNVPVEVSGTNYAGVIASGSMSRHTCAVLADSAVECWGVNINGQLGNGTTTDSNVPVGVPALP